MPPVERTGRRYGRAQVNASPPRGGVFRDSGLVAIITEELLSLRFGQDAKMREGQPANQKAGGIFAPVRVAGADPVRIISSRCLARRAPANAPIPNIIYAFNRCSAG
jgi:hypothetical protein